MFTPVQVDDQHDKLLDSWVSYREAAEARQEDQATIAQLQLQMRALKRHFHRTTKQEEQLNDSDIQAKIMSIFYSIQDFVVTNFQDVAFEPWQLPADAKDWMASHIYQSQTLAKPLWVPAIIGLIARVLVSRYRIQYAFGLSQELPVAAASALASFFTAQPSTEVKAWLRATHKLISISDDSVLHRCSTALVDDMVGEVEQMFAKAGRLCWTAELRHELARTFTTAVKLFEVLHRQNAVFHIEMAPAFTPGAAVMYDAGTMERWHPLPDEGPMLNIPIEVSVFPGVYKFGNADGDHLDQMMIITKAKVVLKQQQNYLHALGIVDSDIESHATAKGSPKTG